MNGVQFTAEAWFVGEVEDCETFAVLLMPSEDSPEGLELQVSLDNPKEESYCLSNPLGATIYGGVERCVLNAGRLRISLTQEAGGTLGVSEYDIGLTRDAEESVRLGLKRLFATNPPAHFEL